MQATGRVVAISAVVALAIGCLLPWLSVTFLPDFKTRSGIVAPAVLELAMVGAAVVATERIRGFRRFLPGVAAGAFGITVAELVAVPYALSVTGDHASSNQTGSGAGFLAAAALLFAASTVLTSPPGRRWVGVAVLVPLLLVAGVAGLFIGGSAAASYGYSLGPGPAGERLMPLPSQVAGADLAGRRVAA